MTMPETQGTTEATMSGPTPKRVRKPARKVATKKAVKAKAKGRKNTWTPEAKKKYRADIKAGRETYVSIAKKLGITPQTAWAQLNRK